MPNSKDSRPIAFQCFDMRAHTFLLSNEDGSCLPTCLFYVDELVATDCWTSCQRQNPANSRMLDSLAQADSGPIEFKSCSKTSCCSEPNGVRQDCRDRPTCCRCTRCSSSTRSFSDGNSLSKPSMPQVISCAVRSRTAYGGPLTSPALQQLRLQTFGNIELNGDFLRRLRSSIESDELPTGDRALENLNMCCQRGGSTRGKVASTNCPQPHSTGSNFTAPRYTAASQDASHSILLELIFSARAANRNKNGLRPLSTGDDLCYLGQQVAGRSGQMV